MKTTLHKTKAFQDAAKECRKLTQAKLRKLGFKGEFAKVQSRKTRAFDELQSAIADNCNSDFIEYLRNKFEKAK